MQNLKVAVRNALLLAGLLAGLPAFGLGTNTSATNLHTLWKVEGKSNVVYLLGSIHLLKPEHYPLAAPIETAFTNSKTAVFEVNMTEMEQPATQLKMMSKSRLPEGTTLKDQLSAETYSSFFKHAADTGLPVAMLDSLKPSMAAMMLVVVELQKLGFHPDRGVDAHFFERARKDGRKTAGLETVDFQIDLATDFTKEEGEQMMKSTLKDIDQIKSLFDDMIRAWQTGEGAELEKLLNDMEKDAPSLFKRLVTDRNNRWIPKIQELLDGKDNAIVIVGAGHMVGKEGVVELLKKKGLKVTQQ